MNNRGHVAKKILDELFATHTDHWLLSLSAEELVRNLDKLRVGLKELPPTIFAVSFGLVNHVKFVTAVIQRHMTNREILAA